MRTIKTDSTQSWKTHSTVRTLEHCWWEYKIAQPAWKMCCKLLTNVNKHYGQTILFLVICPQERVYKHARAHTHTHAHWKTCMRRFIAALFVISQNWKTAHFTVVEWLKIQWYLPQQKTTQQEKWTNSWYIQKRGWLSESLSYVKKKRRMKSFTWRLYPVDFVYTYSSNWRETETNRKSNLMWLLCNAKVLSTKTNKKKNKIGGLTLLDLKNC